MAKKYKKVPLENDMPKGIDFQGIFFSSLWFWILPFLIKLLESRTNVCYYKYKQIF